MKKETTPEEAAKLKQSNTTTPPAKLPKRPPYKLEVALMAFLLRGSEGMNKLDALKEYGDTCLNTTVSDLYHQHGIKFKRVTETVINRVKLPTPFTRYSLESMASQQSAIALVNTQRAKRGLEPLELGE